MNANFSKCRLCLKLGDFCSIFEQDESVKLSEMVMSFANIEIFEGDGLTDRVCNCCIEILSTAYLFKMQCERIDNLLRTNTEKRVGAGYDGLLNQDFHVHTEYGSVQCDNDHNSVKDVNFDMNMKPETSDETDSDIDSIKCVYCDQSYNSYGAHTCHVTCTIENIGASSTGSDETLVAADIESQYFSANSTINQEANKCEVSCVLCDEKYGKYDAYIEHINTCTANVKLQFFVCPLCHEINTEKDAYLRHLGNCHFKENVSTTDGLDTVDTLIENTEKNKSARRQIAIGWSVEDIYQEIDPVEEKPTPTSSPLKSFFSKLGNETFSSRHSTPKKVSFRKLIENGKARTSNYSPFKYIKNYKLKKKEALYSPVIPKSQRVAQLKITASMSDSEYGTPSGTSEDSWKLKQNLICACDKKVFMLSEFLEDRPRVASMITEMGGVVAENTKMEMLATHFISLLPNDTCTGMMVCALATGKWLLNVNYVHDSFRVKSFLNEKLYEWTKHPKIFKVDNTSVEVAKAASFWHHQLRKPNAKMPFEGMQVVLVMKKKYRQYYQMIFKTLKAKTMTYDPRTPGSCCSADYCFVDMRVIERVKLRFFASHNIPVFPYQYVLVHLLNRGRVPDERKYLIQDNNNVDLLNKTY